MQLRPRSLWPMARPAPVPVPLPGGASARTTAGRAVAARGRGPGTGRWYESVWNGPMPWVGDPESAEKEAAATAVDPPWCAEAR